MVTIMNPGTNTAVRHRAVEIVSIAGAADRPRRKRRLSARQVAAIEYVMHLFVEEDLDRGVPPGARVRCAACERDRPRTGAIEYDRYTICNDCATEYELARATDSALTVGQFVRDKTFGDGERYALHSDGSGARPDGAGSPEKEERSNGG